MEQEFINDQEVLLVKESDVAQVRAVAGIEEDGSLKTVPATRQHESDFLKIDRHGNALDNFFTNFMRQAKEPSHFGFVKVSAENVEQSAETVRVTSQGRVVMTLLCLVTCGC